MILLVAILLPYMNMQQPPKMYENVQQIVQKHTYLENLSNEYKAIQAIRRSA